MKRIKQYFWKLKFAREFDELMRGYPMFQEIRFEMRMHIAQCALENIDYDLTECPIYSAGEEYNEWVREWEL